MTATPRPSMRRWPLASAMLLLCAACAGTAPETEAPSGLDPALVTRAVQTATEMRGAGRRVWCVPFARNATGVDIRGNAGTWWDQAKGQYQRSRQPEPGAVMAFSATRSLPLGHVAVVEQVVSDREVRIDHANWRRNQVSLGMAVRDVSKANDWSQVRVESQPGSYGRVYPVDGFILASKGQ